MTAAPRYKAARVLARSAMAELFVAHDRETNRTVVVKRLLPDLALDATLAALFEREIAIARALEHPNILPILDAGAGFYVMELLEGRDLRQVQLAHRKEGTTMPAAKACSIGAAIADALAYAHGRGVIHRDVKPENVFLTNAGAVKVLDFGIARSAEHVALTRTGFTRGTAAYMAPEQHSGLALDGKADVFALGVLLWELLTNRRLWKRDTPEATAEAIQTAPAPPPSTHARIPARLEALVMAMLAKLPATRPTAAIVVNALRA